MSDLWQDRREGRLAAARPLAARMRPRTLDEFVGQASFLGPGQLLRRMLEADRLTSLIFYGPPGTGKTTLAELIARHTRAHFERGNAAAIGVKDVRDLLDAARRRLGDDARRTVFFLDEIHRFNRAQQDVLLGDVERGVVILIGATTENPFYTVNSALVSRSQVFRFDPLSEAQIEAVVRRAIADEERGFGTMRLEVTDEAIRHWATASDGDARRALTALEIAVLSGGRGERHEESQASKDEADENSSSTSSPSDPRASAPSSLSPLFIDLATAEASIQRKALVYDAKGDAHYDTISAFIKSVRGSDPDAAVYWLAHMIEAGEDPLFIARRIAILASEDIGNADPHALPLAAAAYDVTARIGMPECRITLAQAAIYLACAPKSNASYAAVDAALDDVRQARSVAVPRHLMSATRAEKQRMGHGTGYAYAHDAESGFVDQEYLGVDRRYYQPTDRGHEKRIGEYLRWIDAQRDRPRDGRPTASPQAGS